MKNKFILFVILSAFTYTARGQFPAPTNFQFSYVYIMIDNSGYCLGLPVNGPAYCSDFSWNTPDLSMTTATLAYYKLHYKGDPAMYNFIDTTFITTDTVKELKIGIIGWVWVTAVYDGPAGESDSSNIEYNPFLPIGINTPESNSAGLWDYNLSQKKLTILNQQEISKIRLITLSGNCLKEYNDIRSEYFFVDLIPGIYILEATLKNKSKVPLKIIIN
jgi:hypothetical protein